MPFVFVFLIFVVVAAILVGWLAVVVLATILKLLAKTVSLPFKLARRADQFVAARYQPTLPLRLKREDDVQCTNRLCRARLPIEARFCARCGGALPARRLRASSVIVDVRRRGFSQVA